MKTFLMRCLILISILFVAVLAGMQLANDGLKRMKGYNDPTYEQVAHITGTGNGNVEATLLGNTFIIEEKQKELERLKTFNVFSRLGDGVTAGVQKAAQASTNAFAQKIQDIFQEIRK